MVAEETAQAIRKQVEFYFSDSNVSRDKFLKEKIGETPEGWVDLSVIGSFKRMKSLTTELTDITEALKTANADLIVLSEDGLKVKRVAPIPTEYDARSRTMYAKGFPTTMTIDEYMTFWNAIGQVNAVRIRKTMKRDQKPSCFVEFKSEDEMKRVLALNLEHVHEGTATQLVTKSQQQYTTDKTAELAAKGIVRGEKKDNKEKSKTEEPELVWSVEVPGAIFRISNLPAEITFKEIKSKVEGLNAGSVAFVEFQQGSTECEVRMKESTAAKCIEAIKEQKCEFNSEESPAVYTLVEGEEEKANWKNRAESMAKKEAENKRGGRHGGRGGRGGRFGGNDRNNKRSRDGENRNGNRAVIGGADDSAKKAKVEEATVESKVEPTSAVEATAQ
eukprot:CFRG4524T1